MDLENTKKKCIGIGYNLVKRESMPGLEATPTLYSVLTTAVINSFHAMAVNKRPSFGGIFFGGISPSKIGHIAPFVATIQALSKTRVFLVGKQKQRLLCMGRTFTANKPLPLIY
jgi:hypothetical protein